MTTALGRELLPEFERQTGVRVIHKSVQMNQDDLARIMVGEGPDVLVTWNLNMLNLLRANLLVELTPYLNRWDGRQSFFPAFLPTGGNASLNPYTLPIEISPFGVGYSKGAFTAAGLDPESPPQGWGELEKAVEKLSLRMGGRLIRQGFDTQWWHPEIVATFLQLNDEVGISPDHRVAQLATERALEAFEFMSRLYQAAYPIAQAGGVTTPPGGFPMRILDGVTAMSFWSPSMSYEARRRGAAIEIGAFAPRRSVDSEPKAPAYFKLIGIVHHSNRDPAAAWELIKWLFEPENTVAYHLYTQSLPSRHDVVADLTKAVPYMKDWYRVLNHVNAGAPYGLAGIIQAERELFLRGLWGRIDLHEAIDRINRRYQEYLDQAWAEAGQ
ncbi:MAG: extracellular solute-binding protein [Limnochordia bacterium]